MARRNTLEETAIRPDPDFGQLLKVLWRDGRPGYVPFYELFVNVEIMEAILGKPMPDGVSTVEFYYRAGYDYVPAWPTLNLLVGSLIDTSCQYPINDWKSFEEYPWPDPHSVRYPEFESLIPVLPEGMKIIGQTGGIFEAAESLVGYQGLCYLLADEPALVEAIFERLGALYETMYRGMAAIDEVGALVVSDDLGFKTQTLISASDLRKLVLPRHKRLVEIGHEAGKPCVLHSCGQLEEVMRDLIDDVGIDAKHSFEDSILPVSEAKRRYGDELALLGGFDMDRLCRSSEEQIRSHTRALVDLGESGGYALGSGNSIAAFVPVANYLTMLDEGWRTR